MSNRLIRIIVIALAVLLAVALVWRLLKGGASEESEEVAADMAVHVGTIIRATLHRTITAYGTVEPEPAGPGRIPADAEVASPVVGIIASIDCHEGQQVAKGAVLFRLDSRIADIAYEKAKKNLAFAQENFERKNKLLAVEGTSKKEFLEAEQQMHAAQSELAAAETDLALLKIVAPLSGTVVMINSEPGESVELNTVLAKIVDVGRLVAAVGVPSQEARLLKVGQPVQFDGGGTGAVLYIGSRIDDKSDTVPVRTSLPTGAHFLPGQFLGLHIFCDTHAGCLAVPEAAVISDFVGGDSGAIVLVDGDKAVRKNVRIGLRESGLVEVAAEGLKEGQSIISEDAYAVPDGTKIHIVKSPDE